MQQAGLSDFDSRVDGTRTAEAEAVAGDGGQRAELVDIDDQRFPAVDATIEIAVTQVDYTVVGSGSDERPVMHVFGRRPGVAPTAPPVHVRVHGFEPYFYAPTETLTDAKLEKDVITRTEAGYESIRGEPLTKICTRTPRDVGQIREEFDHYEADILFPNRFLIDKDVTSGIRVPDRRAGSTDRYRSDDTDDTDAPTDDDRGDADGENGRAGDGGHATAASRDDRIVIDVHHEEVEPTGVEASPRVLTFDIEVDDRSGFPEAGEEPIVCLASHDSGTDEYVVWLYDAPDGDEPPPTALEGYEPIVDEGIDVSVRSFDTEAAMLDAFLEYVEHTDPDVLTGWNFADFDAPYLLDRLGVLGGPDADGYDLDPNRLSRVQEVWRSDWQGPNVKGRVVFDLLYAYQRTQFSELESYRLDAVAERELDAGKERYPGDIGDLWENDPERLLEYNLRDVELCVGIDRQQDVITFWREVASFVGCKLEDAPTPGDVVDMYVLHEVHGAFALPSKGRRDTEEYEGGAVFDPITGVRENVAVLDLACFSGDTDVATPDGIRNVRELEKGDPIYTLNPETFECEIKSVTETHSYENKYGELHHVRGNTHDFKVTENHRFLLSKTRGWGDLEPGDFEFAEYRDVPDAERFAFPTHEPMAGATRERFPLYEEVDDGHVAVYAHDGLSGLRTSMPASLEPSLDWANGTSRLAATAENVGKYLIPIDVYRAHRERIDERADEVFLKYARGHREMPISFEMDDWLELIGWFVTEGSFVRETPGILLHQRDERGRASIRNLLERMDLTYSIDERGFYLSNRVLYEWFSDNCGDGYAEKHVPEWAFELDSDHLRVLLETMIDGAGSRTKSGLRKFRTKSDRLREDIARLAVRCGEKPTVSAQSDGTWDVSIGKRGSMNKAENATIEDHDGRVYCITAEDNHVVLAGRNGQFQWVGQSLYPMSMVTINASPETKVDPETYDGETYRAPNETRFRKEPDGIIREMVDDLLAERERFKRLRDEQPHGSQEYKRYDRQQGAVKRVMNSLYGVAGWDRFRLYDKEFGAAVTATGRAVLEFTESTASEIGYKVAYGDTDSVMLEMGRDVELDEAVARAEKIATHINGSYGEFAREELNASDHRFEIEFEKLYRRFFQAGKKKRYAGHVVWKDGREIDDIDITGFEYKRSDIAPVTKRVQHEVIERIVYGEDLEAVAEYVRGEIERFEEGTIDLDEIGIPGGIGKRLDAYETDTAQVRGAKYANLLLGTNFQRGSKPKRLYLERVHPSFFARIERERASAIEERPDLYDEFKREQDVICFEYADQIPEEFVVDRAKMLEKTLKGPIARVLEALDLSWDEVKSGQKQTGLGSFV